MIITILRTNATIDIKLTLILATVISAVLSIVVHEISHGYAALACGDNTAKLANRLTLNPLAHFDWLGLVMLMFIGFGWAKPVPVNPNNFKHKKGGILFVSAAGVISNLLMCGISLLLLYFLYPYLVALIMSSSTVRILGYLILYFFEYMIILNIMLAFFNFLPIAPLDGFNFVDSLLPVGNKYSYFMRKYGFIILLALLLISNVLDYVGLEKFDVFYQVKSLAIALIDLVTES